MKCLNCNELIVIKRTFKNLFEPIYQVLCNRCLQELIYDYYYETIPINSGLIHHYYVKADESFVNITSDQLLLAQIYEKGLKIKLPIFYFNKLDEEIYYLLDELYWGDLFVITIS